MPWAFLFSSTELAFSTQQSPWMCRSLNSREPSTRSCSAYQRVSVLLQVRSWSEVSTLSPRLAVCEKCWVEECGRSAYWQRPDCWHLSKVLPDCKWITKTHKCSHAD